MWVGLQKTNSNLYTYISSVYLVRSLLSFCVCVYYYLKGFLKRCRDYGTLFDNEEIDVIFSNIEEVYSFQKDFLKELEARTKPGHLEQSEIGEVFVVNVSFFHWMAVPSQYMKVCCV